MSIELLVMLIGFGLSIATFLLSRYATAHKKGEDSGKLLTEVEYIKNGVDDLKGSIKNMQSDIKDHEHRLTMVEESAKSMHKRLDGMHAPGLPSFRKPNEYPKPLK